MTGILSNDIVFILLFGAVIFAITYLWADRVVAFLHSKSLGNREYVVAKLEQMFFDINPRKLTLLMILGSFGLGLAFFLLLWPHFVLGLIVGSAITIGGWTLPRVFVDYLFQKRCSTFVDQMVDGITIMANGIASGLSVAQSMERVAQNMKNPISQEFNLVLSQIRLGLSLEDALNGLGTRVPMPDVQMFVTSVNILKETGGNMAETFQTIVETIRERQKIQKKIEALTAQGVTQGIIITMVPFLLLLVFLVVDPAYVSPMFNTTGGIVLLLVMLSLQIIGGLTLRKIVRIKV